MSEKFKEQAIDQFEKWSDTYDEEGFFQRHLFIPTEDLIITELLSLRKPDEEFRMLDIGCGTGKLVFKAGEKFSAASFEGVDIAPGMVKAASEKTKENDRYQFQLGDAAETLPFDEGSFDYVSCCHSYHHYPDQESAAREFRRLLKPGGKLLFVDSYINSVWGYTMHCIIIGAYEKFQVNHFKMDALKDLFETVGLEVERQHITKGWVPWMMTVCVPKSEGAPAQ